MVKIDSLGVVSGVELFVTESLPHVEFEWEKFVSPPKASVPATKGTTAASNLNYWINCFCTVN